MSVYYGRAECCCGATAPMPDGIAYTYDGSVGSKGSSYSGIVADYRAWQAQHADCPRAVWEAKARVAEAEARAAEARADEAAALASAPPTSRPAGSPPALEEER